MEEITIEKAKKYGIQNQHSIMENGEKRFRLICERDKTCYCRAESGKTGYWQKSHYHNSIKELYIVQKGNILFVEYIKNELKISKINEGEIFKVEPKIPHNVYMYPNTVLHTVKYGQIEEFDWKPFSKLDEMLKDINIEEIN